uniref:Diacylglycerol lipase-beta n=1 Tax=Gouania willdenowi TaxID=441366 RepID=A0A8C5N8X3_GOUWI
MPGMVVFGRRWGIASDALVFPGFVELFFRVLHFVHQLVWACLGAIWVSDDSTGCDPATVGAVIAAVVTSWIIMLFTALGVVFVFDPLGSPRLQPDAQEPLGVRHMESSGGTQFLSTARSLAAKVWECRLRLMCCCLPQDENSQATFSSIAKLFSGFFSDTDLVPSDIAAGLALLHQEHDKMEQSRDPDMVVPHSPSSPIEEDLEAELEKAAHFMKFAAAAYGWPLYIYSNLLSGPCKLCGNCCRSRPAETEMVGDDLGCHFSSILQITGLQYRDFIHVSFHNQIYEIPFFVALDHRREAVLVAVRGTLSLKDVLTDLSAECENLPIEGVSGACYAHKGISQAANYVYKKLINDGILNQAFSIVPEYKLVITGHSLGAGTASVLAVLLHSHFPSLQCYSFSPPGGLLSKALANYSKDFVLSVVLGKDLVPRLSIPNMEDLKTRILKVVSNCNKPKYRILLQGCWYELFGGEPDDFPTEMENRREEDPTRVIKNISLIGITKNVIYPRGVIRKAKQRAAY